MTCSPDDFRDKPKRIDKQSPLMKKRRINQRLRKEQRAVQKSRGKEFQTTMKEYMK